MATTTGPRALSRALRRARVLAPAVHARYASTVAAIERNDADLYIPDQTPSRQQAVRDAKPFSEFLTDTFNRQHDYLRISVTERCNLRCLYCMPEEGIELSPNKQLLTTAEIYYLSALFVNQGVNKIRLTGGEPTVRKDILPLMQQIGSLRRNGLKELALTTNGISLHRKLDQMVEAGLTGVNISLDTLDPFQFQLLTRRSGFDAVMKSITRVQEMNRLGAGVKLKINCVVMRGLNDHQVLPFVDMTQDQDIEVRFIEYMPFGGNKWSEKKMLPYEEMLDMIRAKYPGVTRLRDAKNDTSKTWQVPGFKGRVGFITSMTHNFCGTCNRLRITSDGNLKVCLHGNTEVSLRDLLRTERNGEPMDEAAFEAIRQIELDRRRHTGLAFDGEEGWITKERQLLDVIGAAVKRKAEKHAGMGELENMQNRPMILIGKSQARNSVPRPAVFASSALRQTSPWSRIPTHLLNQQSSVFGQPRRYSSDSRPSPDHEEQSSPPQKADEGGLASALGFQSLSGLFSPPPSGRYSTPRSEAQRRTAKSFLRADSKADETLNGDGEPRSFFSPTEPPRRTEKGRGESDHESTTPIQWRREDTQNYSPSSKEHEDGATAPVPTRRQRLAGQPPSRRGPAVRGAREYVWNKALGAQAANPWAHTNTMATELPTQKRPVIERPWGISKEKLQATDALADHVNDVQSTAPLPEAARGSTDLKTEREQRRALWHAQQKAKSAARREKTNPATHPELTHVKSSGEAHMVDVGAKPSAHRVAIASATVRFSNAAPVRLIRDDTNKKGDVLAVSRIAGIMASKRTSDLIPLCHPLALTKVDVDVRLLNGDQHGIVAITAQTECVGPTGVEMESLTAASTAALTVVDMCKAVDREIVVDGLKMVYKSGGRSGVFVDEAWLNRVGVRWLDSRGLERPGG